MANTQIKTQAVGYKKKKAQVDFHTGIVDFTSEKVKVQSPSHVMLYIHSKCIKKCNLKAYVH